MSETDKTYQESIELEISNRLKKTTNELSSAVYGEYDSDSLDFISIGWRLGIAYQSLLEAIAYIDALHLDESPTLEAYQNKDKLKDVLYHTKEAASHLQDASLGATDEDGQVELLKLGWRLGIVAQMLHPLIVMLTPSINKSTDELIANAKKVEPLDKFATE